MSKRWPFRARVAFTALGFLCSLSACTLGDRSSGVSSLPLEVAPGSLAPHLSVARDTLFLSWVQKGPDSAFGLWYSRWSGSSWDPGVLVAAGSRWFVNWADIPKLQVHAGGLTAVWLERLGTDRYAYGVKYTHRRGGVTGLPTSAWLHSDSSATEHGFVSLVPLEGGAVQAVWLDGRETATDGPMTLRTAQITEQGAVEDETLLDERVCDCCPTAAVRCPDGSLLVAYRDRSPDEVRDIAVTRLDGGIWSAPRPVHRDEWKIAGCPVNGPSLSASDSLVALAWFAMSGGVDPTVNVSFSGNSGRTFGAPVRVDKRHPEGRVDVAWLPEGSALVVWLEATDSTSSLWARRVSPGGGADTAILVTQLAPGRTSGVPTVASAGGRTVVAWTESGDTTVVRAREVRP